MTLKPYITTLLLILMSAGIGWELKSSQLTPSPKPYSFADAIQKVSPYVVNIYTYRKTNSTRHINKTQENTLKNLGSGVIIENGYILTNKHLIVNANKIVVILDNQTRAEANLIGSDLTTDLAVLQIPSDTTPKNKINTSNTVNTGDIALAIGSPYGLKQSATMGIISAIGRDNIGLNQYENFIQTDAAINPGNSGGALIDFKGNLIGINSAIFSNSGGSQGIGFSIPINDALYVMQEIIQYGTVKRGYLGINAHEVTPETSKALELSVTEGLLVFEIDDMSPAQRAGIKAGDVIVKINREEVTTSKKARKMISKLTPLSEIQIIGVRGNQSFQVNVTIDQLEDMGHTKTYY
ncbi:S1C family serine protease [Marinomonas sp. 2405UD68-3]|uniref:S1C family serine protease n=1 Tax=Marinomonas sp. 2405UD68-3 TaxID=3391835 RepID=UPI0039C90430